MLTPIGLWRRSAAGDRRAGIVLAIRVFAAVVWFTFGTIFKVIGLVPRHREIVAQILGEKAAPVFTVIVGLAETGLGLWFLSGFFPRFCAVLQTVAIASMNTLELVYARSFLLAPVPMIILNAAFLTLVWYAALYSFGRNGHSRRT